MKVNRRTQAERSAVTRDALIAAARALFARDGFAAVSTEAVVRAAGVTRGALYHQFDDKQELFAAVFEQVEGEVAARVGTAVVAAGAADPIDGMKAGVAAWLDACCEPEVLRIVLLDAPAVLGWQRWREIGMRHGMGLVEASLEYAMGEGRIRRQPARPLAHLVMGALDEAALYVARADDADLARREALHVVEQLIAGLTPDATA